MIYGSRTYWFEFFILKFYEEESHIVELLSLAKLETQLFSKYHDLR